MASRKLSDLKPEFAAKVRAWLKAYKAHWPNEEPLIYCTLRSLQEQADLYAQGRTKPGKIVTMAKPGQSAHNHGLAIDAVPMRGGKPLWTYRAKDSEWLAFVLAADEAGLEWAGRWRGKLIEYVHLEDPSFGS